MLNILKRLCVPAAIAVALAGCGSSSQTSTPVRPAQSATGSVHPPGWGLSPKGLAVPKPLTGVATATMYDTIEVGTVPSNPFATAGYTSGSWPTYEPLRRAFPRAHTISIAVSASHHADCLDVEPGDASPSEAPGWIRADRAAGFAKPCLYSSLSPWDTDLFPILRAAGIPRSEYFAWDAHYDGFAHVDSGFDATQWTDTCLGRNLDCSTVTLPFLSIAQPPYSPTPPGPTPGQITHWRQARNSSFSAYHRHGCKNGLVHDKLHARDDCFKFAQRVVYFQHKLWTKYPRWHVFGPHARTKTLIAWIVRPTVSIWSHELAATHKAYNHTCWGSADFPGNLQSAHCITLRARVKYYKARIHQEVY